MFCRLVVAVVFSVWCGSARTQTNSTAPDLAPAHGAAASPATPVRPTDLVGPAIDELAKSVGQTHLERWSRSVRDETDGNLRSIEHDLQTTLPPLLQTADLTPGSVAASLPVLRNLDALVDVMLRVTVTGRNTSPQNELQALNASLRVLEGARRSLDEQIEQLAAAQEAQIADLRSTIKRQAASLASAAPAALPAQPASAAKSKRGRKPAKPQ